MFHFYIIVPTAEDSIKNFNFSASEDKSKIKSYSDLKILSSSANKNHVRDLIL